MSVSHGVVEVGGQAESTANNTTETRALDIPLSEGKVPGGPRDMAATGRCG